MKKLKDILKRLGIEFDEEAELEPEAFEDTILEHIDTLESEKNSLSQEKEELTASVEGYKSREENLSKELSETKAKLATTEGKLEQVTDMYKEQFEKDPEVQEHHKDDEEVENDVLDAILGAK